MDGWLKRHIYASESSLGPYPLVLELRLVDRLSQLVPFPFASILSQIWRNLYVEDSRVLPAHSVELMGESVGISVIHSDVEN